MQETTTREETAGVAGEAVWLPARPGVAHFVGACGVGMAGVAWLLHSLGWKVTGCDERRGGLADWLEREGIPFCGPHDPGHVLCRTGDSRPPDLVVRTPAVADTAPELAAARAAGIPVVARGDVLAALSERVPTVAVCGSHGKTTTSTFLAAILKALRPETTAWCIGGESAFPGGVAGGSFGAARRTVLVAEADESDGTLAKYRPAALVLTNLDLDHVDRFGSVDEFEDVFRRAIARTSGPVIYGADHPRASHVAVSSPGGGARASFGFSENADWRVEDWRGNCGGQSFTLRLPGSSGAAARPVVELRLGVPGRHNALNAAAAIAAAAALGIAPADAAAVLRERASLPARRFERIGSPAGFTVVSDYAHHPSEIAALVATARSLGPERVIAVFQPHRYSRTRTFLRDFPIAFAGLDSLVLCPVYAASEAPVPGGTELDLYAEFRRQAAAGVPAPVLADGLEGAFRYLAATIRPGDLVLVVGAGDVNSLAPRLAAVIPPAEPPAMPAISGYGTRVPVPFFSEIGSEGELRAAVAAARAAGVTPCVVGAGTNTFVAPTGCHVPVFRLRGEEFSFVSRVGDCELEVGAAYPGVHLLDYCRAFGLSGLEALAGIPGTVGGWLAMNAGTRFGSFCDVVADARVLRLSDGAVLRLGVAELAPGYRECPGLAGCIALSVRLRLVRGDSRAVAAAMDEARRRRFDFSGLRSCGSAFRNPPAPERPAGALSDAAGCKGTRIGGAFVSERHGNVIATGPDATASDVEAIFKVVAARVEAASGVRLAREVRVLR